MRRKLFKLPTVVLVIGMIGSTIIAFAHGTSEGVEAVPNQTNEKISINVKKEVHEETLSSVIEQETETENVKTSHYPEFSYSKDWDYEDSYLLAKIAMAEAEGEDIQTKTLVILTVLNRVHSDGFPNTIYDVIFQYNPESDVYQFSPVKPGGRWWTTEPNEDCWEAVKVVMEARYDYSGGALFFESCDYDSWHSKNLTFLYQSGKMRFYK